MNTNINTCPTCRQPIEVCPYGGDCGEVQSIYREQQRQKLLDIEFDPNTCCGCDQPLSKDEHVICGSCQFLAEASYEH